VACRESSAVRMKHIPLISLLVMVVVAIGWQLALTHSYNQGKEIAAQRRAVFPVVPVPAEPVANSTKETEKRLGPFSLGGKNYVVVLRQTNRVPGSTGETGSTIAGMEIRDSDGAVLY